MASRAAAFPAKYAAGSPGRARMRQNVTTTTPARPGAAAARRLENSRRKDSRIRDLPLHARGERKPPSALGQLAEIQLDMEPVLVPDDVLLHRADVFRVLLLIRLEARRVYPLVHLGVHVRADVERGILAMVVPEEEVFGIVEPAPELVHEERHLLLALIRPPVGRRHLLDGGLDADLGQRLLDEDGGRLIGGGAARVEVQRGL